MARIFICGNNKQVFRSDDLGDTWVLKNTGIPAQSSPGRLDVIHAYDSSVLAVGGAIASSPSTLSPQIYTSANGGDTWTTRNITVLSGFSIASANMFIKGIFWVSSSTLYVSVRLSRIAGNPQMYLVKSTNSGSSWTIVNTGAADDVFSPADISFYNANDGIWGKYRLSSGGTVKGTGDFLGGHAALGLDLGAFYKSSNRMVSDNQGLILSYNSGSVIKTLFANHQDDFTGTKYGYFLTGIGTVSKRELLTGSSLTSKTISGISSPNQINGGFFSTGNKGLVVTENGRVYRTTDAAANFTLLPVSPMSQIRAISGTFDVETCNVQAEVISTTPRQTGGSGILVFEAEGATNYEFAYRGFYALTPLVYADVTSNPMTANIPDDGIENYALYVRDKDNPTCVADAIQFIIETVDLSATATPTGTSAVGVCDGQIVVNVTSGSGNYQIEFAGYAPTTGATATKTGLCSGVYNIVVRDLDTGAELELTPFVSQPDAPPESPNTILFVPALNSLTFVEDETPNDCETFQTLDNRLFCKQEFPGFMMVPYYQKVNKCDDLTTQFRSDYGDHLIELKEYITGDVVQIIDATLVQQNIGNLVEYAISIRNNGSGTSRVYFVTGAIPIPLETGDNFQVFNNADGFDGYYSIQEITLDELLGVQYLVINLNYALVAPSSLADGRFTINSEDFDVYEFTPVIGALPNGYYFIEITGLGENQKTIPSEPFNLQVSHAGTNKVSYYNNDNAFDMTYTTGIRPFVRVESTFFKRQPASLDENYRNCDQSLVKLSAKRRRKVLFETWQLPPYLHEKLAVASGHDFFAVNGVRQSVEEDYSEPRYITRYPLANSDIVLEQYQWFDKYNSDDIGGVDNTNQGLLIVNEGFLKL